MRLLHLVPSVLLFAAVFVQPARADHVEVRLPATIKLAPSGEAGIMLRPAIGEAFDLAQPETVAGYYKVILRDGAGTGWIYRTKVELKTGPAPAAVTTDAGGLEVDVINVGQADAILIRCPDGEHQLLIDAGDTRYTGSAAAFKGFLTAHQDTHDAIEVVVASHPHADHIGSMAWLLDTYAVGLYVDDGLEYDSATWRKVEQAWERSNAAYWSALDTAPGNLDFCPRADVSAQVIRWPQFGSYDDPNDNSVIVRVDYVDTCLLFVGDLEGTAEADILADPGARSLLDCDLLKVGHHGSNTSSSAAFLDAVSPRIVAVSCGKRDTSTNTGYRHPRAETLEALASRAEPTPGATRAVAAFDTAANAWRDVILANAVYLTVKDGDLRFLSDGHAVRRAVP